MVKQLQPKEGVTIAAILSPEGSTGYTVIGGKIIFDIKHGLNNKHYDLPPGPWKLIGTSESMSEEQASELLEQDGHGFYKDYPTDYGWFASAVKSIQSLYRSLGLDPVNNTIVVLEKEK